VNKQGDHEAERMVLAHYLVHRKSDLRDATISSEHFSHGKHQTWWISALTAADGWKPADIGLDADAFAMLASLRPNDSEVKSAENRMVRRWQVRFVVNGCKNLLESVHKAEIEEPEMVISTLRGILGEAEAGGVMEAKVHRDVGAALITEWASAIKNDEVRTLPMPLRGLNERLMGWQRGKLYLVGAVTSNHKTTFARMSSWHVAKAGHRAVFWPMEDTADEMAARTFAAEIKQADTRTFTTFRAPEGITRDDMEALYRGVVQHLDSEASLRLRYLDEALPTLSRVLGRISAEAARGVDLIALDFMQLIQPDEPDTNEVQHWFQVSNALAGAAKRLNVAIVVTVQPTQFATREQARHHKPLSLGDLRGGSSIAQSAYGVLLLNRVWDEDGEIDRRCIDVGIAKWKNAHTGDVRFRVEASNDLILD
jgi:replicative DNA helicase